MRFSLAVLIVVATASGCGSGTGDRHGATPTKTSQPQAATARINRCVDRLLQNATQPVADNGAARRYVRSTYCARFEERGWIYDDGALSIAAEIWLERGARCASGGEGEATKTVPCQAHLSGGVQTLDCALLHVVRKAEVREYVDRLRASTPVKCDDGTALDTLGVP
ncbi:MAG: hypothetical protein ACJ75Q_14255 [Gaiellaceae bacterium]